MEPLGGCHRLLLHGLKSPQACTCFLEHLEIPWQEEEQVLQASSVRLHLGGNVTAHRQNLSYCGCPRKHRYMSSRATLLHQTNELGTTHIKESCFYNLKVDAQSKAM